MQSFDFALPATLDEALDLLRAEGAMALGGGTATALLLKQHLISPTCVVALRRVELLRGIRSLPDGGLEVGAGCTLGEIAADKTVRASYPLLASAAANVGNVRVRAVATLGGHLGHADPCQDLPPVLLVLGANVVVTGPAGERSVSLDGFFTDYMETALGPGELILRVELPPAPSGSLARYVKFTPRSADDYATVGVACRIDRDADGKCSFVSVALAGVAPTPIVSRRVGEICVGPRLDLTRIRAAANAVSEEVDPISDMRGSAEYKREMTRVWTERTLTELGL